MATRKSNHRNPAGYPSTPRAAALRRAVVPCLEALEGRRLMSADDTLADAIDTGLGSNGGVAFSAEIGGEHSLRDHDLYKVRLRAGDTVSARTSARSTGGGTLRDTVLFLFDSAGTRLVGNDDYGPYGLDSYLSYTVGAAGDYYIGVSSYGNFNYNPHVAASGVGSYIGTYRLFVTTSGSNAAPVAFNDAFAGDEDAAAGVSGNVLTNDYDPDGAFLGAELWDAPSHGTLTFRPDGSFEYRPAPDFSGADSFTYRAYDGDGAESETQLVVLTVNPVNDAPTAVAGDDKAGMEGSALSFSAAGSADVDGDALGYHWDFGDGATAAGLDAEHAFAQDGVYTVTLTVDDGRGGVTTDALTVTVANAAPTITGLSGAVEIQEGGAFALSGSFADAGLADAHAVSIDWGDGTAGTLELAAGLGDFAASHQYLDDGAYVVTVTVADDGGATGTGTSGAVVVNAAPAADAGGDLSANEGETVRLAGLFTDAGPADTHTRGWRVYDAAGNVVADGAGDEVSFVARDDGTYTATFTVTDDDGGAGSDDVVITVRNAAPTVGPLELDAAEIDEDGTVTLRGMFADAGLLDGHTVRVAWDDGTFSDVPVGADGRSFTASHRYLDNADFRITATVADNAGDTGSAEALLTVRNVGPGAAISAPAAGATFDAGTAVALRGSFTDAGTLDTHTAVWEITREGDSTATTVAATVNADGTVDGSFTPAAAGNYSVRLVVTDKDGGVGTAESTFVAEQPSNGFAAGSGHFDAPAGSDTANPALKGKAKFSFLAFAHKGKAYGEVRFEFKPARMELNSDGLESVVVKGNKVTIKGTATVNGVKGFHFTMTVVDGGRKGTTTVRMTVTNAATGRTVFDNGRGAPDGAFGGSAAQGGNVTLIG